MQALCQMPLTALCQHGVRQLSKVVDLLDPPEARRHPFPGQSWLLLLLELHRQGSLLALAVATAAAATIIQRIWKGGAADSSGCSSGLAAESSHSGGGCVLGCRPRAARGQRRQHSRAEGGPSLQRRCQPLLQLPAGALPAWRAAAQAAPQMPGLLGHQAVPGTTHHSAAAVVVVASRHLGDAVPVGDVPQRDVELLL